MNHTAKYSALSTLSLLLMVPMLAVPTVILAQEDAIRMCASSSGRIVYVLEPGDECRRGYTEVSFGATGPQGESGADGEKGDPGQQGATGADAEPLTPAEVASALEEIFCKSVSEDEELVRDDDGTLRCELPPQTPPTRE